MEIQKLTGEENATGENYIEIEMPFHLYQLLSSGKSNLQGLCRICLAGDNINMYPLIGDKEKSVLAAMFTAVTAVQLLPDDGLPSSICETCQLLVVQTFELKLKSEKSECLLKSIQSGDFIFKADLNNTSMNLTQMQDVNDEKMEGNESAIEIKLEEVHVKEDDDGEDNENKHDVKCEVQNDQKKRKTKQKSCVSDDVEGRLNDGLDKKRKPKHKCVICQKKFTKPKLFRAHMRTKHAVPSSTFPCGVCKLGFDSEHDLSVHSALHAKAIKGVWNCNRCDKEFKSKTVLRRHLQRHMESKPYACEACGKSFTELYALRRHARVHTGETVEKKHACHLCDKRYANSGLLAAHLSRHVGLRPCECGTCGKTFPSPRLLASHELVHSDRKPYACEYCDKRFRHESTRNTHRRTHTGDRPYVCYTCGKSFIQNSNLTLHMRSHTGERPYSCSRCDKKFTSSSSLKSHARIHTGERPYSCNVCGKRFARLNLSAHMSLHTGVRPFACSVCPKSFVKAARLREHCRVHTGEKPFECTLCPSKFQTKAHLIKHERVHEKKKKVDKRVQMIVNRVDSAPRAVDNFIDNIVYKGESTATDIVLL